MDLPLTGVGAFIDCLVLFFFYYRLSKSKYNNNFFNYFKNFTLFFGAFYLLFSVPILIFTNNSSIIGWGYLIGHVFSYVAFGYLARIWLLISKPSFDSAGVFKIYLLVGALVTALNAFYFNYPVVKNGIVNWDQNIVVGVIIILFGLTAFLPSAILFIRESILQPKNRKRYALIGLAFLLIIISGPLHDVATSVNILLIADIITTSGFLLMFWGVVSGINNQIINTTGKS